ncbi:MAG: UDP-N-acetylmuramoyl-L-alanyl-D-glutamate--2,6-diaminopimelate ligase, partial [Synergistaceae bacterium]|nr:UDP-N-acetylmuramoyl-L-alanyl-D-glutamate--2,6-diaminopimelate ligase [Synergistaceae bacterium]
MRLDELYSRIKDLRSCDKKPIDLVVLDSNPPDIGLLRYDNRKISTGTNDVIFACVKGERVDGCQFAEEAVRSGAVALLCSSRLPFDVPQILSDDVRSDMSLAESILMGRPSEKLKMIGVTGTNGKTTTAYITRSIMRASGLKTGMIGTIVYDDARSEIWADRTTPEGPDIQDMLANMVNNGAECCVMEASSHGLDQGRLAGIKFDGVGFSNLTPEHLEYHRDMDGYFTAKRRLFTHHVNPDWAGAANEDDEYGRLLLSEFQGRLRPFSTSQETASKSGCYLASDLDVTALGMSFKITYPDGGSHRIASPLIGSYNASNILEAVAIADSLGTPRGAIHLGVSNCPQIPGRLERYSLGNGVRVFVDYAHSSDGMEKVLSTLSPLTDGNLTVLWGAGGDRTPVKRPIVGGIMAKYADYAIITTDNPRSESPEDIARDVEQGVITSGVGIRYDIVLDRKEAIYRALDNAREGDTVVVAGKGPERWIDYGTRVAPFSDSETVLDWT